MSAILIQNPNVASNGGFENQQRSLYPNTSVRFEIPIMQGKLQHGLTPDELQKVENFYGYKMDDMEGGGFEYYSNLRFNLPDHIKALNFEENPADLLTYKIAMNLGLIAETREDTESPMCNAIFYVYNSQFENKEHAEMNKLKAQVTSKVYSMYEKKDGSIIRLAKYLFETYTNWDNDLAFNQVVDYINKSSKREKNVQTVANALEQTQEQRDALVDVKEAISRSIIRKNTKNFYYNTVSNTEYGKNLEEVMTFLSQNIDELGEGKNTDSAYSIRKQLKQS